MSEAKKVYKRQIVGSVLKSKEKGKMDYIQFRDDVSFKKGECLSLESKESQLKFLDKMAAEKGWSEEYLEKAKGRVEKIPDFVRFEIVKTNK